MVIILGGSGWIGSKFRHYFSANKITYRSLGRNEIDYYDRNSLRLALAYYRPKLVINCAGFTGKPNVDACESRKCECLVANAVLPAVIAEVCESLVIPFGHVSSGCIYTGEGPYSEEDEPNFTFRQNNCSFYSGSKALGEEVLQPFDCWIWRLRIPFDNIDSPRNYLSKLLHYSRLVEARNSLTYLDDFVASSYACFHEKLPTGIYNLTNTGSITTSDVVELIMRHHGLRDFVFFLDEQEFMRTVKSPRSNCVLDNSKALSHGLTLTDTREAIVRCLSTWSGATSR